jgi:hypothetical protein
MTKSGLRGSLDILSKSTKLPRAVSIRDANLTVFIVEFTRAGVDVSQMQDANVVHRRSQRCAVHLASRWLRVARTGDSY